VKLVTFRHKTSSEPERYCVGSLIPDDRITDLTQLVSDENLTSHQLLECFDLDGDFFENAGAAVDDAPTVSRDSVRLVAPVPRPGKIICIGLNYLDHAEESGMPIPISPIIFSKFHTCVIGSGEAIHIPSGSDQVDYEAELAVVIGREAKNVTASEAMNYVFGYTNFNDVSARDFQFADGQWQRGKSCDTFAPMGPFVATKDEIPDPHNLNIRFRLNGETLQDSNTDQLIFRIPELIEFLSRSITLEPGDIIATGTPPGVGFARKPPIFMKPGDLAEVEIEGLGVLSNSVLQG
jgi:2-keto-4-pentenoate hydratase/2-oxohepta-3-ene-1,7-dioic acid hydratase in catechol pathway